MMLEKILENNYCRLMLLLAKKEAGTAEMSEAAELLKHICLRSFFSFCLAHELEAVVYNRLSELNNSELPEIWSSAYAERKAWTAFMMFMLKKVAQRLEDKGIPMIALKNSGLCAAFADDFADYPMGDVDILVKKEDFLQAHKLLCDMGFRLKFRSMREREELGQAFINGSTEYCYEENGCNMWLEMSWRPVAGRWMRIDREPDARMLINSSSIVSGTKIRILSPEDNLLQIAIHTAKHSYVREPGLRLHLDVERVVWHQCIDWEMFIKKVCAAGTKTAVYFSLYIAGVLFKTPIPGSVLEALRPGRLKERLISGTLKKAGLLYPKRRKFSKAGFILFQALLYDRVCDIFRAAVPSVKWLKHRYDFNCTLLVPYYLILRLFDLAGLTGGNK